VDNCVAVVVKETGEKGCITRRLDADAYEIWLESGSDVVLSPRDFHELERKEK